MIRHATAIDETIALRDPMRMLTAHHREQARQLGQHLRERMGPALHVWTSPLVRAVQTAELVLAGLGSVAVTVDVLPSLAPGESVRAAVAAIRALADPACVLLVGHEAGLSGIAAGIAAVLAGHHDLPALANAEALAITGGTATWRIAWDHQPSARSP